VLSLKKVFCRHCGVGAWVIDGDMSLLIGHLRRVHPRA